MISTSSPLCELGQERRDAAVDLGSRRGVADVGVDRIGEVDRRRAARQRDQPALRREAEDLVVEQLELGVLEELLRVVALGEEVDGAPQPLIGAALARRARERVGAAVLVERVRGDAVFGDLVHRRAVRICSSTRWLARADHGRVDRAVVVLLRGRDVVLVAARAPSARWCGRRRAPGSSRRSSSTMTRKPKMSESCSKPTDLRSILRQIE